MAAAIVVLGAAATVEVTAAFDATYLVGAAFAGCGSGAFLISEQLTFVGWGSGQYVGTWQIIPGSGRGELASITGSGTVVASAVDAPIPDAPRTHVGAVACDERVAPALVRAPAPTAGDGAPDEDPQHRGTKDEESP